MGLFAKLFKTANQIKPVATQDTNHKQSITDIDPEYLVNLGDGILPGHVVLLWWLNNKRVNHDRVPDYFKYKYGINVESSIATMTAKGYLSEKIPTEKGTALMNEYSAIIYDHRFSIGKFSDGSKIYKRGHIKGYDKDHQEDGALAQTTKQIQESLANFKGNGITKYDVIADPNVPKAVRLEGKAHIIDKAKVGVNCPPFTWDDSSAIAPHID